MTPRLGGGSCVIAIPFELFFGFGNFMSVGNRVLVLLVDVVFFVRRPKSLDIFRVIERMH